MNFSLTENVAFFSKVQITLTTLKSAGLQINYWQENEVLPECKSRIFIQRNIFNGLRDVFIQQLYAQNAE